MRRYTQIICTLGPASSGKDTIQKLSAAGMGIARINFSHSDRKEHQKRMNDIRSLNKKGKAGIQVLADLEGYRIRLGSFKKKIHLPKDGRFVLSNEPYWGDNHLPLNYTGDFRRIKKGSDLFIDDGKVYLRVTKGGSKRLSVKVIQEGVLTEHKGVNIPGLKLEANIMTRKDKEDLEFALRNKVENIAQSFVRNRRDIQKVADLVKPRLPECRVIAKIENREGLRNIDHILDVCDGVMIARGDLGVTLPIYKIPIIQKHIIRHCNRKKKFSITATQMLDSMIENSRPTRAEVSDVANAVLDGTDHVMLSGETAVGKYPVKSVQMMRQIVEYTEQNERVRL